MLKPTILTICLISELDLPSCFSAVPWCTPRCLFRIWKETLLSILDPFLYTSFHFDLFDSWKNKSLFVTESLTKTQSTYLQPLTCCGSDFPETLRDELSALNRCLCNSRFWKRYFVEQRAKYGFDMVELLLSTARKQLYRWKCKNEGKTVKESDHNPYSNLCYMYMYQELHDVNFCCISQFFWGGFFEQWQKINKGSLSFCRLQFTTPISWGRHEDIFNFTLFR